MFDLAFLSTEPLYVGEEGWRGRWGLSVLGDFEERFVAPIEWWQPADYERQWILGARRLLAGAPSTAFTVEAGRLWWIAWRAGAGVAIHQQLLLGEQMEPAWMATADEIPYELVSERVTHTEDGDEISKWRVTFAEIHDFVTRRASTYIPD
jgi:hypothetical protein